MGIRISGDGMPEESMTSDEIVAVAKAWVERALSSASSDDVGYYQKMLTDLMEVRLENDASISALQLRLRALAQSVYFINVNYHQVLLDYVLGMSVWSYGAAVADALLEFVVNLATANGGCVGPCMDMLVRNFLPPSCGLPAFNDTYNRAGLMAGWLSVENIREQLKVHRGRKESVLQQLHAAIKQLTYLVPTTPLRMQPVVFRRMPHRSAPKEWNLLYLDNMLRLENLGGHYFSSQMLPAVIDYLIQIDVEIRWEDILADETGKVFVIHMDREEEFENREGDLNEAGDPTCTGPEASSLHALMTGPSRGKLSPLDDMADKMDDMMDMTLQHLRDSAERGKVLPVFDTLMKSFEATILHTYKSKFTQFLIFYFCSLAPNSCGSRFADHLCDIITSRSRPANTRMSAAAYLASFLARAKYLPASVISTCLKRMMSWCIAYGSDHVVKAPLSTVSDAVLHCVFYSVCQAVMYTLCFRFKFLADDLEGKRALRGLQLQQLVEHRLQPLKICLPTVVEEFIKRASSLQLVDQSRWVDMKEQMERSAAMETFGDTKLDMFFPFDPYLLRQSDRFIRPNFVFWYMVEPMDENDASDYDEDLVDYAAGSDASSDEELLPLEEDAVSPASSEGGLQIEDHSQGLPGTLSKSYRQDVGRSGSIATPGYDGDSTDSDDDSEDSFQTSFDAMAITPPESQRMPAKLPARLPAQLPARVGQMVRNHRKDSRFPS